MEQIEEWIPLPVAAERIGQGYARARELLYHGRLGPADRHGGRLFVTEAGVERFIASRFERARRRKAGLRA